MNMIEPGEKGKMIIFELTMPGCGSWNGKWSGECRLYAKSKKNNQVPNDIVGKRFYYRWDDGWTACVSVNKVDCKTERRIMRQSSGFCGYDWMIDSIIKYGKILTKKE